MANTKISALTSATTPLAGTEVLPIVQSSATVKVAVSDLTAGRSISVSGLTNTGLTASMPVFTDASKLLTSTGVVPVANGGTNASAASITAFNNITGYTASGATGTTSTNLVFSTSPSITTPTLVGNVTVSTGNLVIGTSTAGLTSTGTITCKSSSAGTDWAVYSSASATNPAYFIQGGGSVNGIGTGANAAAAAMYVNRDTGSLRSINAAGSLNASGADYAEYMVKDGDFILAKGDICGIKANGKLTNVFADAVSFVVKSTDPSYVGGDTWFNEQPPQPPIEPIEPEVLVESKDTTDEQRIQYQTALAKYQIDFEQYQSDLAIYNADLASWKQRLETARAPVDRIAFCGVVPVNVQGAISGQFIIPVDDNGAIKGAAISNPTFEQYQAAVGKVIAVEADGRAKIIVKIA